MTTTAHTVGYAAFREFVGKIDNALSEIERANKIPDELAYEQRRITPYHDSHGYRPVSDEAKGRAKAALEQAVEDARRAGEAKRDAIIAAKVAEVESYRNFLGNCCGRAIIDLGCIARAAISKATSTPLVEE